MADHRPPTTINRRPKRGTPDYINQDQDLDMGYEVIRVKSVTRVIGGPDHGPVVETADYGHCPRVSETERQDAEFHLIKPTDFIWDKIREPPSVPGQDGGGIPVRSFPEY